MKQKSLLWTIVQTVTKNGCKRKRILDVYTMKYLAQNRMNEIVVEYEDKQDEQGNFIWGECERPWWSIAKFKCNALDVSMRIEVCEKEITL